jgi:hypothetical protein
VDAPESAIYLWLPYLPLQRLGMANPSGEPVFGVLHAREEQCRSAVSVVRTAFGQR